MEKKQITQFPLFFVSLIWLLGFLIYSQTFHSPFLFDDISFIDRAKFIYHLSDVKQIWNSYPNRFIGNLSFALNYHFHQQQVFGYHLTNLIIHLLSASSLFWLIQLILKTPQLKNFAPENKHPLLAAMISLIFVAHPLQIQAVTQITQRFASLAGLFFISSLCFYLKARVPEQQKLNQFTYAFLASILAILGMFTRQGFFTLIFVIFLCEGLLLKKSSLEETPKKSNFPYILVCFLLISLITPYFYHFDLKALLSQQLVSQSHESDVITSANYFLTQFRILPYYLQLFLFPFNLNFDYDIAVSHRLFELLTLSGLCFLLLLLFLGFRLSSKNKLLAFGIFWFFAAQLIDSSIFPISYVIALYRMYVPLVGLSIIFVGLLYQTIKSPKILYLLLGSFIMFLAVMTFQQNLIWKDKITFWNHAVKTSPNKSRPYHNLAEAYLEENRLQEAQENLIKANQMDPNNAWTHNNFGLLYLKLNQGDKAMQAFQKALALRPNNAMITNNLGQAYLVQGDLIQSEKLFLSASLEDPNFWQPLLSLSTIYQKRGLLPQAIKICEDVTTQYPHVIESRLLLTELLLENNDKEQAIAIGRKLLNKKIPLENLLGLAGFFATHQLQEPAIDFYQKALEWYPEEKMVYVESGKLLGNSNQFAAAIQIWEKGLRLAPQDPELLILIQKARQLQNQP